MTLPYGYNIFYNAPTFEAALSSPLHTDSNLLILGRSICARGLEDKIGVSLLHKHFSIKKTEILLRVTFAKGSFTFTTSNPPDNVQPCAWALDQGVLSPTEYIVSQSERVVENDSLAEISKEMLKHGLGDTYTLIYLPAYPDPGSEGIDMYEMTNEKIRLSLISNHVLDELRDAHFAKSAFAFRVLDKEVTVIPRTKCLPCLSCSIVIEPVNELKIKFFEENIFGTSLSLEGYEFQDNLITQEFIKEMYRLIVRQ